MDKKENKLSFDNIGLFILSITLFLGGIYILSLKIPFWSMFLGIASIQIGIVLIIISFEHFTKKRSKVITENYKTIPCLICKKINYVPKYQNTTICDKCQLKIAQAAKSFMVVVIAVFSISTSVHLIRLNQDIREKAKTYDNYICEEGMWDPKTCQCGYESNFKCPNPEFSKVCEDNITYCCKENSTNIYECRKIK